MSETLIYLIVVAPFLLSFGALWLYCAYGLVVVYPYRPEDFRSHVWLVPKDTLYRLRLGSEWLFLGKHGYERYRRNLLGLLVTLVASFVWLLTGSHFVGST